MLIQVRKGVPLQVMGLWLCLTILVMAQNGRHLMNDQVLQQVSAAFGEQGKQVLEQWVQFVLQQLNQTAKDDDLSKLNKVNRYFNQRLKFVSDQEHWKQEDYWATPMESLMTQGGDCEDYVIAKYFSLIQSGVAQEKLRITYVKAVRLNQAHMVLAYYAQPKSEPLILDNLNPNILQASKRRDLVPVYSFNGIGMWIERQQGSIKVGTASRLSRWMDVLLRMQDQGLGPWTHLPGVKSFTP